MSKGVFVEVWGEWPSGLRRYIWNWKVLSSNPNRQGLPNRVDWWGDNLGKMAKNCMKMTKSALLGQSGNFWELSGKK